MKKSIIASIIFSFFIFSTGNVGAGYTSGAIEDVLDLNYGIEESLFQDISLQSFSFKNANSRYKYEKLKEYDRILKEKISEMYRNDEYDTYAMNGIITNYGSFIYYANKYFYFLSLQEKNPHLRNSEDMQDSIISSYRSMNSYFKKTKSILIQQRQY